MGDGGSLAAMAPKRQHHFLPPDTESGEPIVGVETGQVVVAA